MQHGIHLTKEMLAELRDRNYPVHTGLMPNADARDFDRDLRKLALVRTLLVGLVAIAIGYRGRIAGWEPAQKGFDRFAPANADWWPVDDDARDAAARWYVAVPNRQLVGYEAEQLPVPS